MDQPDALVEVAFIGVALTEPIRSGGVGFAGPGAGRMRERALEVVEDRDELLHEPLVGARGQLLLVARHPLAVVVELGLQALERVEILVALLPRRRELVERLGLHRLLDSLFLLDVLLEVLILGHSSTTSYSASSTTSSSGASAEPSAPFEGCDAEACA